MRYLFLLLVPFFLYASKPELLLLKSYDESLDVKGWLMSEKLDGVRAYWDGKKLISRGGKEFQAPKWFIKDFPPFALDGELWSKRGDFEYISSVTSKKAPHKGWEKITYNIFEVPYQKGGLLKRLEILQTYLKKNPNNHIHIIKQFTCKNKTHLKSFLKEVELKGGEGVVVRNPKAEYIAKRTDQVLKFKSFQDAECEVITHHKGKGKYKKVMGALTCKKDGKLFKIGSGFSDEERKKPPKIGDIITFKYQGYTKNKLPRFPVFLRIREEF